jgi:hypothetical protein
MAVPVISAESKSFSDRLTVTIENGLFDKRFRTPMLFYKVGDTERDFKVYTKPVVIDQTSKIYAFTRQDLEGRHSNDTISASFFKKPNNYTIAIKSKYNKQYHAGGPEGLIDGIYGTENWRKGDWQGYQSQDFECVVDLKQVKPVKKFDSHYLQDSRSWILMPVKVEYYGSTDNVDFKFMGSVSLAGGVDAKNDKTFLATFPLDLDNPIQLRYVKVRAINYGKLPEGHQGFGGDAFIFIDEIEIQ